MLVMAVSATASVFTDDEDDGGSRPVTVTVSLETVMGNKAKKEKTRTVLYCAPFYKKNQAIDAQNRLAAAITRVYSGDAEAVNKELRALGKVMKRSKPNGVIEENLMTGNWLVVFHEDFGAKAVEIKPGMDRFFATLQSTTQQVEEVEVTGDYVNTGISMKPVPGMDTGDQVTFTINFEVPAGNVSDRSRLICQPMAVDCQTEDTMAYLQPIILEGRDYHRKQDKRMAFDYMKNDSVARGYDPSVVLEDNKPVAYSKSVVYKKPDKEKIYRGSYRVVIEDYLHKTWDSGERTTGSCLAFKPLKFLDFSVTSVDMPLTTEFAEPAQENIQKMNRDLDLKFEQSKDVLLSDSVNTEKLNSIVNELRSYGDRLIDVKIQGGASAEGSIEYNTNLAKKRAQVARNLLSRYIKSDISVGTLEPRIFTWNDLLESLGKQSGKDEIYDMVKNVIETHKQNEVYGILKGLPFYETDIVPILEGQRIMVLRYRYENKHIMTAQEAVESYYSNKESYMSGKSKLSNGDYFNLFASITDSAELENITAMAYRHITSQSDYDRLKLSPYVANQMALITSRRGMPDVNILRPFIDLRKSINQKDLSDPLTPLVINREQIVLNQAVMYFQEAKLDTAMYLIEKLEKAKVQIEATHRLRMLITFQRDYTRYIQGQVTDPAEIREIEKARDYVFSTGDFNRAIIYSELHSHLNKSRQECEALLDRMSDDNPKKWYLKGIIWADQAGKEPPVQDLTGSTNTFHELTTAEEMELQRTDPEKLEEYYKQLDEYLAKQAEKQAEDQQLDVDKVPYFLAYFQHSFDLEKRYIRLYRSEGNVSDDIRKKYKYTRKDIPAYRKKFEILKAYYDQQRAEENASNNDENVDDNATSDSNTQE